MCVVLTKTSSIYEEVVITDEIYLKKLLKQNYNSFLFSEGKLK